MKILLIIGALVVVLLGAGGALAGIGYGQATASVSESQTMLRGVGQSTVGLDKQLKDAGSVDFSQLDTSNPDFNAAKKATDDATAKLQSAKQSLEGDRAKLATSDSRLATQTQSPLTLPFRSRIADQRDRVDNAISALDAGDSLLGIAINQYHALSALMDGAGALYAVETAMSKTDINGALGLLPNADSKLAAAKQAAQGPNMPPQLAAEITAMQKLSSDFRTLLQAAQRHDAATAQRMVTQINDDIKSWSFDDKSFSSYEQSLGQPYIDRYERGMKAAGFTLTG